MTRRIPSSGAPRPSGTIGAMVRGCSLSLAMWAGVTVGYLFVLSRWLAGDDLLVAPFLSFFGLWMGSAIWTLSTGTPESRAVRKALSGSIPRDGERFAAIGVVVPCEEELEAPLSGRACVAYEYEIFTMVERGVDDDPFRQRDYAGFRRVPFVVRTAQGDHAVLGFGNLQELPELELPAESVLQRARDWVASTRFTPFDRGVGIGSAFGVAESLASTRSARVDSRALGAELQPGRTFTERALPSGAEASAIGTYSVERGGLVSSLSDLVVLRLGSGADLQRALASQRRGQL